MRKIIHIDMDAFYASIEQRDNPELKGKPIAVGYSGNRGVVASASYEARRFGVKSAMASKTALRKCPNLVFVNMHFDVYESVSQQIMNIFLEYTDLVEPLSLDEAFLDVTTNHKNIKYATQIAKEIKEKIFIETGLTASAGVAHNKFLAKIASDYRKPNGIFVIKPKDAESFVETLPIELFFGVGKITAQKMHQIGIKTGFDLKQKPKDELVKLFGKSGYIYYQNSRAIDERPVTPNRTRKSVGVENTFEYDIQSTEECIPILKNLSKELLDRIQEVDFEGRTITLKVKYCNFQTITRSKTFDQTINRIDDIYTSAIDLVKNININLNIRLLGLSIKKNEETKIGEAIQLVLDFKD